MAVLEYPKGIRGNDSYLLFRPKEYRIPDSNKAVAGYETSVRVGENDTGVCLYVPPGISEGVAPTWSEESMTWTTAGIINLVEKASTQGFGSLGGSDMSGLLAGVKKDLIGYAARTVPGFGKIKTQAGGFTGATVQPNDFLILQGPSRQELNLNFELIPQNAEEGNEIRQIIKSFRRWTSPRFNPDTNETFNMLFPYVFNVYVVRANTESVSSVDKETALFYYEDMACTNFNVAYSSGSGSVLFYEDGSPVTASLSIGLRSVRPSILSSSGSEE